MWGFYHDSKRTGSGGGGKIYAELAQNNVKAKQWEVKGVVSTVDPVEGARASSAPLHSQKRDRSCPKVLPYKPAKSSAENFSRLCPKAGICYGSFKAFGVFSRT